MANKRIETTELDFDALKTSLKNYLKGQSEFSDYDFDGSGLDVLLDVLTYNTHYNALYYNLAINEAFLDSASKRSSVVSKAKELGYTPKSATVATAKVTVTVLSNQLVPPSTFTLSAFTPFTTYVDGKVYTFYNIESQTAPLSGNQYILPDVILKEGTITTYSYTYDGSPIIIPNANIDRSTLTVSVQENATSSTTQVYTESTSVLNVTPTSTVYFVRELEDQTTQLEFGNDIIGKALENGNVITVQYFVGNDEAPNGASSFTFAGSAGTTTVVTATTINAASGGAGPEDIESIRFNAPYAFTTQNRCVTADDYKATILSLYTPAKSVSVWGGESNIPPQYGKVFITIVPESMDNLSASEKQYVIDTILAPRKALTATPVIIDPMYVRLEIDTTFYYDPNKTTRSATELETLVRDTINDYNNNNLGQFGAVFKYSNLVADIDAAEQSITSNITTLKIHFNITPVYNVVNQYTVDLGNPIYNSGVPEESIISTGFVTPDRTEVCYIDDVPPEDESSVGTLRMFYVATDGAKVFVKNVGTVNYDSGIIMINDLEITNIESDPFKLVIKPQSNDVVGIRDQFVYIDQTLMSVSSVVESTSKSYTFTSSRN